MILAIRLSDIRAKKCSRNACANTAASTITGKACAWLSCWNQLIQIFPGLNLTFEVREGLQKHQAFYDPPGPARKSIDVRRWKRRSRISPTKSPTTATIWMTRSISKS